MTGSERGQSVSRECAHGGTTIISRYLGIDFGAKRIGLAVGDTEGRIATPLRVITRCGKETDDVDLIIAAGDEYAVDAYVLGIPFNMDGTEGPQAKLTRAFGKLLAERSGHRVHEWDERLSSRGADANLTELDLTHKKKKARQDALAAQIILQAFLDGQP